VHATGRPQIAGARSVRRRCCPSPSGFGDAPSRKRTSVSAARRRHARPRTRHGHHRNAVGRTPDQPPALRKVQHHEGRPPRGEPHHRLGDEAGSPSDGARTSPGFTPGRIAGDGGPHGTRHDHTRTAQSAARALARADPTSRPARGTLARGSRHHPRRGAPRP
jgi:hypothetical protein